MFLPGFSAAALVSTLTAMDLSLWDVEICLAAFSNFRIFFNALFAQSRSSASRVF